MKLKFKGFLVLLLALITQISFAQERTVSGIISDNAGLPLPGVSVLVKGSKAGTQTDFDGKFSIKASANQTLVLSYIGMKTQEVSANSTTINVKLKDETNVLDAVVVVGYGTQTKKKSTDAISRVTAKDIQQIPVANVQNALVGKLAGVQVTQTNGKVEGGISIRVRGGR